MHNDIVLQPLQLNLKLQLLLLLLPTNTYNCYFYYHYVPDDAAPAMRYIPAGKVCIKMAIQPLLLNLKLQLLLLLLLLLHITATSNITTCAMMWRQ